MSARTLSLGARLNHGAVSRYLAGGRPSPEACKKLATFLEVPESYVLELAGYTTPSEADRSFVERVARLTKDWSAEERELGIELLRTIRRQKRGAE